MLLFKSEDSRQIRTLFEKVRAGYLLGKDDPKHYRERWFKALEELRDLHDDTGNFASTIKDILDEKTLFSEEAKNPETDTAKRIFQAIKDLRYDELCKDPFSEKFKEGVLEEILENLHLFVKFLHWAFRKGEQALPENLYTNNELPPDDLTNGYEGLDLAEDDVLSFIEEHYADDKDTSRLKSKYKGARKLLSQMLDDEQEEKLISLDLQKAEKSFDFLVPNKPMYRIFDIEDMDDLKGFTGEYIVQEKYDGMRIQIHKIDDRVKIFSFNEKDITDKCPEQVKIMKGKKFPDCILDGELLLFDKEEPLHRAEVVARIFKNKKSNATLRAHVFDIMRYEDKDLVEVPLKERIKILFEHFSAHSDIDLAFPSKKDTRLADSLKEVEKYSKEIMQIPTAEGVVIKDIESTYFIGTKKNPKWIKWKKFVDLDVIVLDRKKTNSNLFSYTIGVGPVEEGVEIDGKKYLNVGKALNTKINVEVGDIIRVKVDEVRKTGDTYSLYSAKVIEIPEVETPDKPITLDLLSKDTKKSISYKVEALKKSIVITDHIHGTASVVVKSELDGFTIFGFEENNLMAKNALNDLDFWKEEIGTILKEKKGKLRVGIKNFLQSQTDQTASFDKILNYLTRNKELGKLHEEVFDRDDEELNRFLKRGTEDMEYVGENKFRAKEYMIEKYETPDEYRKGQFKIYKREDGSIQFNIKLSDELLSWVIKIEDDNDIFNLFGKSKKFPAEIAINTSMGQLIDSGEIELGVQRHGYHEYMLDGNKFDTRFHFRVVPMDNKKQWVAFSSVKTKRVDESTDAGIWDIRLDKFKKLTLGEPAL